MAYVPGFEFDLFLSYASGDNDQGAVEEFAGVLQKHISDNLVNCFSPQEKVRIYFDRERLASQTAVNWEDHLKAAASSSALFVPLLSPNYLSSPYCNRELGWFTTQSHIDQGYPFSVAGWRSVGQNPVPPEFKKAERHPAGESWFSSMRPAERMKSTREFALKLRDAMVKMRASVSAVFLGPAAGRAVATRSRLRDELEKYGFRVVPDADYVYRDAEDVRSYLKGALLAIHFLGDGLDLEGLAAIKESFVSAGKTVLVQPKDATLLDEEAETLREIDSRLAPGGDFTGIPHTRLQGDNDSEVWETVKREVRAARFRKEKSAYTVGIACEARDLAGAKTLAGLIHQLGVAAKYPAFDIAPNIEAKLKALRETITQSQALLCYWATADGRGLRKRLKLDARSRYNAKAWYLAPPLDMPQKEPLRLRQSSEMVLEQRTAEADPAILEPFLLELGWERQK
jgi:hypothetical protein